MLSQYFDAYFCINLASRADRWAWAKHRFATLGIPVQRWEAVDGDDLDETTLPESLKAPRAKAIRYNKYSYALVLSTISLLEHCLQKGYQSVCIFEDDVVFSDMAQSVFSQAAPHLPQGWHLLHLGYLHQAPPETVSPRLHRVVSAIYCHAYAVSAEGMALYLEYLRKLEKPIDIVTQEDMHPMRRSYCTSPAICYQMIDYSNISHQIENHWTLKEQ